MAAFGLGALPYYSKQLLPTSDEGNPLVFDVDLPCVDTSVRFYWPISHNNGVAPVSGFAPSSVTAIEEFSLHVCVSLCVECRALSVVSLLYHCADALLHVLCRCAICACC